jgi:hypothetical protein
MTLRKRIGSLTLSFYASLFLETMKGEEIQIMNIMVLSEKCKKDLKGKFSIQISFRKKSIIT